MPSRPVRGLAALALLAACAGAWPRPVRAQLEVDVEAAASVVKYEGFLSSGAASVTPSIAWRSRRATLAARGTFLMFESGNSSVQGLVSAVSFTGPAGPLRLEAGAEAGANAYASFAPFSHALARLRLHVLGRQWGMWGGPLAGGVLSASAGHGVTGLASGAWGRLGEGRLDLVWTRVVVGDTTYADLRALAAWHCGALDAEASQGWRAASRGGAPRRYGDVSLALRVGRRTALVVSGGRYRGDPVSGSIASRFVSAGFRVALGADASASTLPKGPPAASRAAAPAATLEGVGAAIENHAGRLWLVVRATDARLVEVMGDFTDWQPVALAPAGPGRYRLALDLGAGLYRFNVRVDGGPWGVPEGIGVAADDFGGSVGVLALPPGSR